MAQVHKAYYGDNEVFGYAAYRMRIAAASTALPRHYYPQRTLINAFKKHWGRRLDRFDVLERLHAATKVDGRYLAMPIEGYPLANWGEANNRWIEVSLELGEQAICRVLQQSGVTADQIGAFFFVSITGIASPSIEARLMNRMRLSPRMKRIPIFGLGCVAGAAGIARAADYVKGFPDQAALLLSVELCSLTIQQDDLSTANLISSGLFGDGAAAVMVTGAEVAAAEGPTVVATRSIFYPETEYVMGWDISHTGFRIVLSRDVPDVVEKNLGRDVDEFLDDHQLSRCDVESWVIHTGGPKVLEATEAALGLKAGELEVSWQCLRRTGNLSSASVLFVLEQVMKTKRPRAGSWGILAAMGPAFCSELILLKW
ncbi:MAG TPA: 3-oxoacyl-[acyl-carrier-protein] synthase III C-terminal domain-containing protein [Bryobacteraceae bacterium]|nr:3-oxoacyl-[acyl-carrier-protein] synthase III C-terminal domain-containing protein [Bryobacteraceae bacterium]